MERLMLAGALGCALILSACANTVYGPRRLLQTAQIDDGKKRERHCPAARPTSVATTPIDLSGDFYDRACDSLRSLDDTALARRMIEAGVTLNRIRCNDFFAQRAANQTRQRIISGTVAPISAVLTGIIGVANFDTGLTRQEAIQLLAIGQSATIAGLELYQSEFLFGSANINSVRTLTMRALDEHAAGIASGDTNFHGAARHLIDHQMICTPANILEMSQKAIRDGRIEKTSFGANAPRSVSGDAEIVKMLAASLRVPALTADQVGSLWWLADEVKRANGAAISANALEVIQKRLEALDPNPVGGTAAAPVVDTDLVAALTPQLARLSDDAKSGFAVDKRRILAEAAKAAPPTLLERTGKVSFTLPTAAADPTRAIEVQVAPASAPPT